MKTLLAAIGFSLAVARPLLAGSDLPVVPPAGPAAAAAGFESYLQEHKVNHSIDISDDKAAPQGPVMVKIYGELAGAQQNGICAALSAVARRTRTETSTVQFFALEPGATTLTFQASRLPSGSGDVSVNRKASAPTYRLVRSERL